MLKLFNTLGRELEEFKPLEDHIVKFYQCGPTVYWTQHIGNMRAMVMADLIRRSLGYMNYDVKFVRNYTDFGHLTGDNIGDADTGEDRMEKGAKREGITPKEVADKYIAEFEQDVKALNVQEPTVTARATDYIDEMIKMVQELLDKGYAYPTNEAIYFDITKFQNYTALSGQNLEMNKEGEGHGEVTVTSKKNPFDFALWFFRTGVHSNALQYWPSPFVSPEVEKGNGFPGWHIECSAMVRKNLGKTIDIHMGGVEHIPTHHTNEIAQSEAANGVKYVDYWLHNEHLDVDGTKMSKSLGNVYNVIDLIKKGYDPLDLRYFFLQAHYRSKQNFTFEALDAARSAREKLITNLSEFGATAGEVDQNFRQQFIEALEDDFNIPKALAVVWEVLKSDLENAVKLATILDFDKVLGLDLAQRTKEKSDVGQKPEVQQLIKEREEARVNKDWKKSDELRDRLKSEFGVDVKDEKLK